MADYDGTKLLSLKDINGKKPEIYICTSNRTAGKTTYFNRYFVNRFIKYSEKFILLYRLITSWTTAQINFLRMCNSCFFLDMPCATNGRQTAFTMSFF